MIIDPATGEEVDVKKPQITIDWPTGKGHISFSELANWVACSWRHKLLYIEGLGSYSPTPHVEFGTGIHASSENYVLTREMDRDRAYDVIRKSWKDNHDLFTKGPFPDWSSKGYGEVEDWIKIADRLMDEFPAFLDETFPGWTAHAAEEYLFEDIKGAPLKFKGFIDAVLKVTDKRGKELYWIIDWKTCGWGWHKRKKQDPNILMQLILYKHFWAQKHGIPLSNVRCAFGLLKRDGKPGKSIELFTVSAGPKTINRSLKVIEHHVKSVKRGMFLKNRDSCRFCDFENTEHCSQNM